ncbi:MAG: ring-cleaving dioxygenase [Planctomycetes bacterium]|nr:ring-cleaving dioxygenase [Planctomycetota bacterium]
MRPTTTGSAVPISGIHHITAIASDPQKNIDFYVGILCLRMVKKTVNFDDPGTYHFYFGDAAGSPGTILTFFPWPGAKRGTQGSGSVIATAFAVPVGSIDHWASRLSDLKVAIRGRGTRFGNKFIAFEDHDGMGLEVIETPGVEALPAWGLDPSVAIRGFHSATLSVRSCEATSRMLREGLGMVEQGSENGRQRFVTVDQAGAIGRVIDLLTEPDRAPSRLGAGVVHHIAVRASDDAHELALQRVLADTGYGVTEVRERFYFRSVYYRERGGVLFEIATDAPGFAIDEAADALGTNLKLPPQYEGARSRLEAHLPPVTIPSVRRTS